jgi:hypothetical protein
MIREINFEFDEVLKNKKETKYCSFSTSEDPIRNIRSLVLEMSRIPLPLRGIKEKENNVSE